MKIKFLILILPIFLLTGCFFSSPKTPTKKSGHIRLTARLIIQRKLKLDKKSVEMLAGMDQIFMEKAQVTAKDTICMP